MSQMSQMGDLAEVEMWGMNFEMKHSASSTAMKKIPRLYTKPHLSEPHLQFAFHDMTAQQESPQQ